MAKTFESIKTGLEQAIAHRRSKTVVHHTMKRNAKPAPTSKTLPRP